MKVLEKGTGQLGWTRQLICTGNGNGGGGCGAKLLVEQSDLFITSSSARGETDYYITFRCAECGVPTDLPDNLVPDRVRQTLIAQKIRVPVRVPVVVQPERRVNTGVALVVADEMGRVLLGKRKGSHGAGTWSFIGGWMQHGESFGATAKREAMEEAGIEVQAGSLNILTSLSTVFEEDVHSVTVLLYVPPQGWRGTPVGKEPDKLDGDWGWFYPSQLPSPLFKPLAEMAPSLAEVLSLKRMYELGTGPVCG